MARPGRGKPPPKDTGRASAVFVGRNGYTPCAHDELLDHRLSGDELRLLLVARYISDRDETDGFVSDRQMKGMAALLDIAPAPMTKALAGLNKKGRLVKKSDGFFDVGFAKWCRSSAEREARRERWKDYSRSYRRASSALESPETLGRVSPSAAAAPSASPSQAAALSPDGAAAESDDDVSDLTALWGELTGKPASSADIAEFRSWKRTFGHRVSESEMAGKVRAVWQRQVARGDPPKHPRYFAGLIQELYEHMQRNRSVVGINEPPEELPI